MIAPRPYRDQHDLKAMHELLIQGRKANKGSYYIHTGDLSWWLYYPPMDSNYWDHIYVWDDPHRIGRLMGWVLISPEWMEVNVYVQPELRGSNIAWEMHHWAEEKAICIAHVSNKKAIYAPFIQQDDTVLQDHYRQREFHLGRDTLQLNRQIDDLLPAVVPSDGYIVRSCLGEPEVAARANAQYMAFASSVPFDRYLERFTSFMRSPVYQTEMDIVAVAPGGQIAAFCLIWIDLINQVGLFEPVGTHPDFQRRGLGKAVMLEGLHRMHELGMKSAIVSTGDSNLAGIKLYEAVGFNRNCTLGTYIKEA